MLNSVLNTKQAEILKDERRLIQQLLALLAGGEPLDKDMQTLQQGLQQLDELFLLVVVGEFNAGKSALINALLGERYLTEGVTPTTAQIHILRHGDKGEALVDKQGILTLHYPSEFLRELALVDTPGTNAVVRHHEQISRDFVPRSDLILFATSADRPFSESERTFLEVIRNWGKKVVLIINKFDLLEDAKEQATVLTFVRENVTKLLGSTPEIFPLSARTALRAKLKGEESPPLFAQFEKFLLKTLNEGGRVRLKLDNPLGVSLKIAEEYVSKGNKRLELLDSDMQTIKQVERQLTLYKKDLTSEFQYHKLKLDAILNEMQQRGETFFEQTMRLGNLFGLMDSKALSRQFEEEVVAKTPQQIETQVQEMIDWMVDRESRQWRTLARQLGQRHKTEFLEDAATEAAGGFEYNRRQLLQSVGRSAAQVVRGYDSKREAQELSDKIQQAIAMVGLTEAGAIGLGAILVSVLTTLSADITGILFAGFVGLMGLGIMPYRRGEAKKSLRQRVDLLREKLHHVLQEAFHEEIERSGRRLADSVDPYSRFVRAEHERLTEMKVKLEELQGEMRSLRQRLIS